MERTNFLLLLAGAALASPVAAAVCFWKGKWVLGLMGAVALPAAGFTFIKANNALARPDAGMEFNLSGALLTIALVLVISVLALPGLFGAVRLASPNSRWASTRYDEDKMNRALTRAARDYPW